MTEDAPVTPRAPDTAQPQPSPSSSIPFDISQEFGTAQRNLPPAKIVGIALACVLVIVAIYALTHRAKPQGGGSIDNIVSIEVPNQNQVMTAINISLRNTGEKPMWIHDIPENSATNRPRRLISIATSRHFPRSKNMPSRPLPRKPKFRWAAVHRER